MNNVFKKIFQQQPFTCPDCRSPVNVLTVEDIPTNYYALQMLPENAEEDPVCPRHPSEPMQLFCTSCKEFVCNMCSITRHGKSTCNLKTKLGQLNTVKLKILGRYEKDIEETQILLKRIKDYRKNVETMKDNIAQQTNILFGYQMEVDEEIDFLKKKQVELKTANCLPRLLSAEVNDSLNLEWRNKMLKEVTKVENVLKNKVKPLGVPFEISIE